MNIKINNPNKLPTIDYRSVEPFQGELKDLSNQNFSKLKNVLTKRGFDIPLFLWHFDGVYYLMDGHQRQRVMVTSDMNDDGSYMVPYILIEARDKREAKAKLLEITSQYGKITQTGLDTYIAESELAETEVYESTNFDALDFKKGGRMGTKAQKTIIVFAKDHAEAVDLKDELEERGFVCDWD
jgi:hypothetical protein